MDLPAYHSAPQLPKRRDYAAFCLACLATIAASHAMSFICFLAVGVFHLLWAPKGGRWLRVCGCVATAMLLFSPWAYVMLKWRFGFPYDGD